LNELLKNPRQVLGNSITKAGGNRPISNCDLANKYTKFFRKILNTINFENLLMVNPKNIFLELVNLTHGKLVDGN
jgi:hypothetical protein